MLALVLTAVYEGRWHRLRACPDCGWVFYDTGRGEGASRRAGALEPYDLIVGLLVGVDHR